MSVLDDISQYLISRLETAPISAHEARLPFSNPYVWDKSPAIRSSQRKSRDWRRFSLDLRSLERLECGELGARRYIARLKLGVYYSSNMDGELSAAVLLAESEMLNAIVDEAHDAGIAGLLLLEWLGVEGDCDESGICFVHELRAQFVNRS